MKHKLVAERFKETEPSAQSSLSLFSSWFSTSQYSLLQLRCFLNYYLNAGWLSPLTHWFLSLASNWFFLVSSSALETLSHQKWVELRTELRIRRNGWCQGLCSLSSLGSPQTEEECNHLKLSLGSHINPTPDCRRVFCPLAALSGLSSTALNPS